MYSAKRSIKIICVVILLAMMVVPVMANENIVGDLNNDGIVSITDVMYLYQHLQNPEKHPISEYPDYNNDGEITEKDAQILLRHVLSPEKYPLETVGALTCVLNDDGMSYSVSGTTSFCNNKLIVPDSYLGYPVTGIKTKGISNRDALETVVLGKNIEYIGENAFYSCANLKDIYILNEDIDFLHSKAIIACNQLEHIYFAGTPEAWIAFGCNTSAVVVPNYGHSYEMETLSEPECGKEGSARYTCTDCGRTYTASIPALEHNFIDGKCEFCGATKTAFSKGLKFELHETGTSYTVTGIGTCADYDIVIPGMYEGLPVRHIGNGAFSSCQEIRSVIIPEGVVSISDSAFIMCSSLTNVTLPSTLEYIGPYAFSDCTSLVNIVLPDGLLQIMYHAFSNCESLTTIDIPDSVAWLDDMCFYGCISLESATLPANLTKLDYGFFGGCKNLKSVNIPENLTVIEGAAFNGCALTNIRLPDTVVSIGFRAFSGCDELVSINIPEGVTCLEEYTFAQCSKLVDITLPTSITSIENNAFQGCTNLKSIAISNNVNSIGDFAFSSSGITNIVLPSSITSIGTSTFSDCRDLESIELPDSVISIGAFAFSSCYSLTTISLPNNLEKIEQYAFAYCDTLTSLTIPTSVTFIGDNVCKMDTDDIAMSCVYYMGTEEEWSQVSIDPKNDHFLQAIVAYYSENEPNYTPSNTYWRYVCNEQVLWVEQDYVSTNLLFTTPEETSYCIVSGIEMGANVDIVIPAIYENRFVTKIGAGAFFNCTDMVSVAIPRRICEIGTAAFQNCTNLSVIYYGGSSADWENVTITENNAPVFSANIFYYSEVEPDFTDGRVYWHYVEGEIVVWTPHPKRGIGIYFK